MVRLGTALCVACAAIVGCATPPPPESVPEATVTLEIDSAEDIAFGLPHVRDGDRDGALQYLERVLDRYAAALQRRAHEPGLVPALAERTRCALHRVQRYREKHPMPTESDEAAEAYADAVPESACWATMEREARAVRKLVRTEVGEGDPLYACALRAHAVALERLGRFEQAAGLVRRADGIPNPEAFTCMQALEIARKASAARKAAQAPASQAPPADR
jgi:hypothetical protein